MKQQNLKGQNNQCCDCSKLFKSNAAFDKHRIGNYSDSTSVDGIITLASRRCMTDHEMISIGMAINARGFWVTALYEGARFYDTGVQFGAADIEELDEIGECVGESAN